MDENATQALNMAFAVIVLVLALSISMLLFTRVSETADALAFYSDSTKYYDNVELVKFCTACNESNSLDEKFCTSCNNPFSSITDDQTILKGTERYVSAETIIPTLYRYYKENFCVKIYDATNNLIQVFDVKLEGDVRAAVGDTIAGTANMKTPKHKKNHALDELYNDDTQKYYLFGAPWLGSTENVKTRVDYFVNGEKGYINNVLINYENNLFYKARMAKSMFKEQFINYSYSGETFITDDGDELVKGASEKDKIVIIYKLVSNPT